MAVPKEERLKLEKQTSYSLQNFSTGMTECPSCGEYKLSHRVCKTVVLTTVKKSFLNNRLNDFSEAWTI